MISIRFGFSISYWGGDHSRLITFLSYLTSTPRGKTMHELVSHLHLCRLYSLALSSEFSLVDVCVPCETFRAHTVDIRYPCESMLPKSPFPSKIGLLRAPELPVGQGNHALSIFAHDIVNFSLLYSKCTKAAVKSSCRRYSLHRVTRCCGDCAWVSASWLYKDSP
jgi:hypothetical protein